MASFEEHARAVNHLQWGGGTCFNGAAMLSLSSSEFAICLDRKAFRTAVFQFWAQGHYIFPVGLMLGIQTMAFQLHTVVVSQSLIGHAAMKLFPD